MRKNLAITTLLVIAYSATIPINLFLKNNFLLKKNPDIIQNIFGGFRDTVSTWSIIKGEEYFHKGLPFLKAEAFHEGGSALMEERSHTAGGAPHEHEETHQGGNIIKKDFFSRVYSSVRLTRDSHLSGVEEKRCCRGSIRLFSLTRITSRHICWEDIGLKDSPNPRRS